MTVNFSRISLPIVSNKFNEYFVNVGETIAAQIPMSGPSFHSYLSEANKESIFLTPTDQQEIHSIILNIKDSAPGHDGLSTKVINPVIETLLLPLTYITNLSFTEGFFPHELKIAQVLPLYKNNDPMLFNNYRLSKESFYIHGISCFTRKNYCCFG